MPEMENPFEYGKVATGRDFVDREKELDILHRETRSGKSVVLYSHRRMGKSSLLLELARRHQRESIFVYVDMYGITSKNHFLEIMAREISAASQGKMEKLSTAVSELIRGTRLRVVVTEEGAIGLELGHKEVMSGEMTQIFDMPEAVAAHKGKRVVVMFDEFQELASMDGVAMIKRMRSRFQLHKNAVYIFAGSKRHLLAQIFDEEEGAFFKFARPLEIGPVPLPELERLLIEKFRSGGGRIGVEGVRRILDATSGHPYYTVQIAHELFDISKTPSSPSDVDKAIETAIDHQSPAFSAIWDSVGSDLQKRFLVAVAKEPGVNHGMDFIERYGLKTYSHLRRTEGLLKKKGLIDHGELVDPLFAMWLRRIGTVL